MTDSGRRRSHKKKPVITARMIALGFAAIGILLYLWSDKTSIGSGGFSDYLLIAVFIVVAGIGAVDLFRYVLSSNFVRKHKYNLKHSRSSRTKR
jgi:hypothetical protein